LLLAAAHLAGEHDVLWPACTLTTTWPFWRLEKKILKTSGNEVDAC
jgi:hypothetical protein